MKKLMAYSELFRWVPKAEMASAIEELEDNAAYELWQASDDTETEPSEMELIVREWVEKRNVRDQIFLYLRFGQLYSWTMMAEEIGCSRQHCQQHVKRLVERLKSYLLSQGYNPNSDNTLTHISEKSE